jgi:1-acyl-sn-glycerol-3-phosphate acyltransferase
MPRGTRVVPACLAALATSALGHLYLYRLSALVWGHSTERAQRFLQHWSIRAWRWLGLRVEVHGHGPATHCLYVANHRSYLDVPVLSGVLGATFMSRADVASWRVVGSAAQLIGTVFVERDDPHGRVRAARGLARRLCTGSIVVFPEGTTGAGLLPGPFHPGLFRLLHHLRASVVPVTVRYSDRAAYWTDEVGLGAHLRTRVLSRPGLTAVVHIGRALSADEHADGESLERAAYRAICAPIAAYGELV